MRIASRLVKAGIDITEAYLGKQIVIEMPN